MDAYNRLRQAVKRLADIPDELIEQLYTITIEKVITKGEFFIREGESSRYMGFILDGLFRLFYVDSEGNESTKAFSKSERFLISYSAIAEKRPSYFNIEALKDSCILQFEYENFEQMMNQDIRWYPFAYKLLESVYIMKELREKSFLLDDAAARYQEFKNQYAEVEDEIKLYHVASFLGITPEALSRIRKKEKLM